MKIKYKNPDLNSNRPVQPTVVIPIKNVGISIILTILFGPIGMFYATVSGAIIMTLLTILLSAVSGGVLFFPCWLICIIWGALSVSTYNHDLIKYSVVMDEEDS